MIKIAIAAALATAFALPAAAQGTTYYIVRDASTKHCTVTHEKPTGSSVTVVSGNKVYHTESEAQSAMKTTKVCTED